MAFQDGINLGQGVCDLEMPRPLRLGTVESIFKERATYTPYGGIRPLREVISRRYEERYGLKYSPTTSWSRSARAWPTPRRS